MPFVNQNLRNLLNLRELVVAKAKDAKLSPVTLTRLTRAYCELDERIRIAKNKPLPKNVDVTLLKKHKAKPTGLQHSHEAESSPNAPTPTGATEPAKGDEQYEL